MGKATFDCVSALLRTEHTHGRNRRRSRYGKKTGQDGRSEQNDSDGKEWGEVERLHAEQKALHGAADELSADEPEPQSDGGKKYAIPNDEGDDPIAR